MILKYLATENAKLQHRVLETQIYFKSNKAQQLLVQYCKKKKQSSFDS